MKKRYALHDRAPLRNDYQVGTRLVISATFDRVPDFSVPFQWRDYDLRVEPPDDLLLGVPVELRAEVIAVRRVLQ